MSETIPELLPPVAGETTAADVALERVAGALPAVLAAAGPDARRRTVEFFTAEIRNPHTRAAYLRAVRRFFAWCDVAGLEFGRR